MRREGVDPLPDTSGVLGSRWFQTPRLYHDSTVRKGLVLGVVAVPAAVSAVFASAKSPLTLVYIQAGRFQAGRSKVGKRFRLTVVVR